MICLTWKNDEHDPLRLVPVPPKKSHRKTIIITVAIVAIVALVAAGVDLVFGSASSMTGGLNGTNSTVPR